MKPCPCGIHPADCTYHRDAWEYTALREYFDRENIYWAATTEAIRVELEALCDQIREAYGNMLTEPCQAPDTVSP